MTDGFDANDLILGNLRRQREQRARKIAEARVAADARGKEPFDLARLSTLCDTTNRGRPDPEDVRRERFEHMYYVERPEVATLEELAAVIRELDRW